MSTKLDLKIEGMTCGSCSKAIATRLSKFDFTAEIDIDHDKGTGQLVVNEPAGENRQKVVQAIEQLGYKVLN